MRTSAILLILSASACFAQNPFFQVAPVPDQLRQYLSLTDDQATRIVNLKTQLASFQASKAQRQAVLQGEIAQEMAKPSPDATYLGFRYVEIELIRRDIQKEQKNTVDAAQLLLTVEQKAKLSALQQALQLQSTACAALDYNLLALPAATGVVTGNPFPGNIIPPSRWFDTNSFASFLLGPPCSAPFTGSRSGSFFGVVPQP